MTDTAECSPHEQATQLTIYHHSSLVVRLLSFILNGKRVLYKKKNGRLEGSTTFSNNSGGWGGAIFNAKAETEWYPEEKFTYKMPVISYPDDTVFSGNIANVSSEL